LQSKFKTDFNHPPRNISILISIIISSKSNEKVTFFRLVFTESKGPQMKAKKNIYTILVLFAVTAMWLACNKPADNTTGPYQLSYGDSILYLKASGSNIIYPTEQRNGVYTGFPEGIEIDEKTGAINIANSETGLRYKITHTATDGTITTTTVVLSGITFFDKFYRLSQNDSIAIPVYNASEARALPISGSNFDDGNNANSGGCSVRTDDGKINLAECVRNGIFGTTSQNDVRKEFDIFYRLNDGSIKSLNKIRVRLYYYNKMSDVAPDLLQTLQDRQTDGVFFRINNSATVDIVNRVAKPRPPCVIIVAQ